MPHWLKVVKWWWEYALLYLLFLFARVLPRRILLGFGRGLGRLVWQVLRLRRGVVLQNLTAAFGQQKSRAEIHFIARQSYACLGATLMEFFTLYDLGPSEIRDQVRIEGREHLDALRGAGQGALLVSGHYGNWEMCGAGLAAHGYPVSYLIKSQSNPYVDRMQNEIRRRAGTRVIRQGPSVRELVRALRRAEFVGLLSDQDAGNGGIFVDFLGRPASVFRGPAYFAYRLGCPILPAVSQRLADGTHQVTIGEPILPDPNWDEPTAIQELTRRHTAGFESIIRRHPEQYFWVHRRWKTRPPGPEALAG